MSVEVADESGTGVDADRLVALSRFVLSRLGIHPAAELSVTAVDEETMAVLHRKWMGEDGATDVLSFPMDELRPPREPDEPSPTGMLGDVVLCPVVAHRQAAAAGHSTAVELDLLTTHGILHLLGYDHAERDQERDMFGVQGELLAAWTQTR